METFLLKSTCIDLLAPSPSTKTKTGSCLEFLLSYQSCPRMARSLPQVLTPASSASDLHLARVATAIAIERTPGLHKAPFSDPLALVLSLLSHRLIHTREKLDCDSRPSVPDSHPQPKWQCPQNQGEAAVHFGHKGALWIRAPSPPALTPALTKAVTALAPGEKPQVTPASDPVLLVPAPPPVKAVVPTAPQEKMWSTLASGTALQSKSLGTHKLHGDALRERRIF